MSLPAAPLPAVWSLRKQHLVFAAAFLLISTVFILRDIAPFLPLVVVVPAFVYWSFRRPAVWLSCIILLHAVILQKSEGITVFEVVYAAYFFGFLGFWFFDRIVIRSQSLLNDGADMFLAGFLTVCLLSGIVALLSGASMLYWLRELLTVATLLLYFPARELFRKRKGINAAIVSLLLLSTGLAVNNIIQYGSESVSATYLFEVLGSRQASYAHFFVITAVVTLSLWIHRFHERRFPPLTLLAFVLTATALIATFSRGFWIGTIVALFFLFLLLDRSKKILVLAGALGLLITVVGVLWLFAGDLGQAIVSTIGSRFLSSGKALEDVSFANRLVESAAAFDAILKSPILGHGLGSSIHYFSLLNELTVESWYLHNGYLFLLFKVGFFGTLLFLGFYGSVLLRGLKAARATKGNSELSPVLRGTWAALASFVIVTITSNVFIERESLLLISLGSAFLMNMHDEHQGYDARTFT